MPCYWHSHLVASQAVAHPYRIIPAAPCNERALESCKRNCAASPVDCGASAPNRSARNGIKHLDPTVQRCSNDGFAPVQFSNCDGINKPVMKVNWRSNRDQVDRIIKHYSRPSSLCHKTG